MLKVSLRLVCAMVLANSLMSCSPFDEGFTFIGEYEAARSGFLVRLAARGNIPNGSDVSDHAYSFARICPVRPNDGIAFEMSLVSELDQWIVMESRSLGIPKSEWNGKTSEELFKKALNLAGYNNVFTEEILGSVKVINGSLAGPKGAILNGQIETMVVLNAKPEYGVEVKRGDPSSDWISELSLQPCEVVLPANRQHQTLRAGRSVS
jgi:hypothetical protein